MRVLRREQEQYMEFDTFLAEYALGLRRIHGNGLRRGQHLMNTLHDYRPDLYRALTGLPEDSYYDDSKIPQAMEWIEAHW
jgi:hypothetical protein